MAAKKRSIRRRPSIAESVLEGEREASLLDVLDHVLNKGVMATGDITLGVAGVDLIYLRLSTLLCAADRVLPPDPDQRRHRTRATRRIRP